MSFSKTKASETEFQRLQLKQFPSTVQQPTPEATYWQKFRTSTDLSLVGSITDIDVNPANPHDVAVTASTRVSIVNTQTGKVTKAMSRFRDIAYSGRYRSDGKLLVAGGKNPVVQVMDVASNAVLRGFRGHSAAVRATAFSADNIHVVSGSDDKTARYWDLATGKPVALLAGHKDYVRDVSTSSSSPHLWATSSYDHTVKLWDLRSAAENGTTKATFSLDHGAPVESSLITPGGALLLSAGDNVVKVWDLLSGGRLLHEFSNHQKTITKIALDGNGSRLLSSSLDGHVKVYDLQTYEVVHGFKADGAVLSFGITPSNSHVFFGGLDGKLGVRHRSVRKAELQQQQARRTMARAGTYQYFIRGKNAKPSTNDFTIATSRHKRLQPYDRALRKFDYKKALNEALTTRSPVVVASMLEELRLRVGLKRALAGRSEESLEPLLSFLLRYVTDPKYAPLLIPVCSMVVDLYASKLSQSVLLDQLFVKLSDKVTEELKTHRDIQDVVGMLDTVMAAQANSIGNE